MGNPSDFLLPPPPPFVAEDALDRLMKARRSQHDLPEQAACGPRALHGLSWLMASRGYPMPPSEVEPKAGEVVGYLFGIPVVSDPSLPPMCIEYRYLHADAARVCIARATPTTPKEAKT